MEMGLPLAIAWGMLDYGQKWSQLCLEISVVMLWWSQASILEFCSHERNKYCPNFHEASSLIHVWWYDRWFLHKGSHPTNVMHLSPLRLLKFKRGSVFDVDFAMVSIGQIVYACCKDKNQQICKLGGWVVEADESSVVIATNPKLVKNLPSVSTAQISSDQPRVAFVRLPGSSVVDVLPAGWAGPDSKSLPPLEPCKQTWNVAKSKDLRSSDAEAPAPMVPPSGLTQELAQMQLSSVRLVETPTTVPTTTWIWRIWETRQDPAPI